MSVDFGTHEVVWHKPPVVAPLVCDKTGTKLLSDSIWRNQAGRYHTEFPGTERQGVQQNRQRTELSESERH